MPTQHRIRLTCSDSAVPQPGPLHQRDNLAAKEFQVRQIVEEVHLHAVATRFMQSYEPLHDLLWRADQVHVAADHPLRAGVAAPGSCVSTLKRAHEVIGRDCVLAFQDSTICGACWNRSICASLASSAGPKVAP